MPIKYVRGDATAPTGIRNKIIAHVCNDSGRWGKGFVVAVSRRWPQPEARYRAWFKDRNHPSSGFKLGAVQFVEVECQTALFGDKLWIANMVAQHGVRSAENKTPIRYDALSLALQQVAEFAKKNDASVHMPKIGAGLAGGDWNIIETHINECLIQRKIPVTVYEL